jgi:2-polyprenyl-3-methyl-5-hydroxy-6-metoxy-1,4-benzoquinol methylase
MRGTECFEDEASWEAVHPTTFPPERFLLGEEEVAQVLQLAPLERGRVLDLCRGPGRHVVPLARRGLAVTGVDRSLVLLARAREHAATAGVAVELVRYSGQERRGRLHEAGFEAVRRRGGLDGRPCDRDASRLVAAAQVER